MRVSKPSSLSKAAASVVLTASALLLASPAAVAEDAQPKVEAGAPVAAVEVIFTGFARRGDKGAAIFVRMTREVPVAVEQSGRRIVYRLSGAKLGVRNNANPLPTELFGPPVSNVALVPNNGNVDVVIDLSSDPGERMPSYRFVSQSGIATLVVELSPAAE